MEAITTYKKKMQVTSGYIDEGSHLTATSAMEVFQDMVTEQAETMGVSGFDLKKKCNAFWVVTKSKIIIDRLPFWNEKILLESFPSRPASRFCNWNCIATDSDEEPLWHAKSEMCILDFEKQNVMRMKSTCFPMDLEFREPLDISYSRLKLPENADYVYTHRIRSSDIDMSHHTNNVKYNRIALDAFTCAELADMKLAEYEIDFVSQSHEGDDLDIFRYKTDSGWVVFGMEKADSRVVFTVQMTIR